MKLWLLFTASMSTALGCDCGGGEEIEPSGLAIASIEPSSGPTAGGTSVELRGEGFAEGLQVSFGETAAASVEVIGPTIARAVTPPHPDEGLVDLTVTLGDDQDTLPDAFEFLAAPRVDAVDPGWGSVEGGTAVVVTGAGFAEGAIVEVGGVEAAAVARIDGETINARTPPGAPGFADVTVRNPDGQEGVLDDGFEYRVGTGCRVSSTDPAFGARSVPIIGALRVEWSEPVSTESASIVLTELGGDEIPIDVQPDGDRAVVVQPDRSLRFWSSYSLVVEEGQSLEGLPCEPGAVAFSTVVPEVGPRDLRPASVGGLALDASESFAIVVSRTYRGLQVYDVSDPAEAVLVAERPTELPPVTVVVAEDRAYAPAGFDGVLIFDVSDPSAPELVGRGGTPGLAAGAAPFTDGQRLYLAVADGKEGVRFLDVTDPGDIADMGTFDPSAARAADVRAVDVEGELLAIADGARGLELVSIADPSSPILLDATSDGQIVYDVLIDGDILYAAEGAAGLRSFSLADPSDLQLTGLAFGPNGECGLGCIDVFVSLESIGDALYGVVGRAGAPRYQLDGAGGMTLTATVASPGGTTAVAVSEAGVFLGGEGGLVVFEPDPADGADPLWFDESGHGIARDVVASGGYAYVAASKRGLQTFSLADPESPLLIDRDDSPGSIASDIAAFSVAVAPGLVVLGDGRAGVTLYDASTPDDPEQAGSTASLDRIGFMDADGQTVYACDDNWGVDIFDVGNADSPILLGRVPYKDLDPEGTRDQCRDVAVSGDILYVANLEVLAVVDVSDPESPATLGRFRLRAGDALGSLALAGEYLLATTTLADFEARFGVTHRLQVFDISDPVAPTSVWVSDDLGAAAGVEVAQDVAFVAAGDIGILVYDIFDPGRPYLEGVIATPGDARGLDATVDALYVAQMEGGLQAVRTGPLPVQP